MLVDAGPTWAKELTIALVPQNIIPLSNYMK